MSSRINIADRIYALLPMDEEKGMNEWRKCAGDLKLKDKDLPTLDVLTCVYNAEKYIGNAIESILYQSYPNIHLVVVTDPCTDKTIDIIKEYAGRHPNITLVENTEHKGIIECFNIGLTRCTNDFIARMDLDDLIHPMRFELQMDYLHKHPEHAVVSAWMKIFNEKHELRDVTYRSDFDLQKITMLFFSPISHAASIFRADVLRKFGYRNDYKYAEDYDLWSRIMDEYTTSVYPEFLYLYRTHSNQVTNERNLQIIKESWVRIMNNVFRRLGMTFTNEDILFHVEHCQMSNDFKSKDEWLRYHRWMERIYRSNLKAKFFNPLKLAQFIHKNHWVGGFEFQRRSLSMNELVECLSSPYFQGSFIDKNKLIIKHILKR